MARPLLKFTLVVPVSVLPPGLPARATVTPPVKAGSTLPYGSLAATTKPNAPPATTAPGGGEVTTSCVAAAADTSKVIHGGGARPLLDATSRVAAPGRVQGQAGEGGQAVAEVHVGRAGQRAPAGVAGQGHRHASRCGRIDVAVLILGRDDEAECAAGSDGRRRRGDHDQLRRRRGRHRDRVGQRGCQAAAGRLRVLGARGGQGQSGEGGHAIDGRYGG